MARASESSRVPAPIERFVKQLLITFKAVALYPPASDIPIENAVEAVGLLRTVLQDRAEVRFGVFKDALYYSEIPVYTGQPAFESFAREFYNRSLAEIRFHSGLSARDIVAFLGVLKHSPTELADAGGFESRLWELGVDTITVTETVTKIVNSTDEPGEAAEDEELWPPDSNRIDKILAGALGGRPRDQRVLVRVLGDPAALTAYMSETLGGRGSTPQETVAKLRITDMIRIAAEQEEGVRNGLYQAVAQAIRGLEPGMRRRVLTEKLLPEARNDDSVASVVRQMYIDEVCQLLVEGLQGDEVTRDGVARALRNLAMISLAERDDVVNAAGAAMRSAGVDDEVAGGIIEDVAPTRLRVKERPEATPAAKPVESIMQLIDLAPGRHEMDLSDPEIVLLQEEVRKGISDGDVVAALVTLSVMETREGQSISIIALLEDSIELLVERGDFGIAADAAAPLVAAIADPDLGEVRRIRMRAALEKLAGATKIKYVIRALRTYRADSSECKACKRLLASLGHHSLEPMLEILANEPDMAARKVIVDLISENANAYVVELGRHVMDPRWYFVRNVVSILGSTRDSAILPFLGRTLRHSDPRVRRETIRSLSTVVDRLSTEMLVAALSDADGQNVQLAARYLGVPGQQGSIPALEQVA
ncbi:MAG: HEAT repeat domain-containing protein, partial [Actinomycetota bacterium]|nr:HEAT repeat domain-containing protein [Actinomycetota bacterium]